MSQMFSIIFTTSFAFAVLRVSTPLIFAGMAAVVSERCGVTNVGIEGMMLSAALTGVLFSAWTQSAFVGLLAGLVIAVLLSMLLALFALDLGTHHILSGLSINVLAKGGTIFVLYMVAGDKGKSTALPSVSIPRVDIPLIKDIPVIGDILSGQNLLTYLSFVAVAVFALFLYRTRTGLRIRAVGETPSAVTSVGVNVRRTRYIALMMSGLFSGFAGIFMSMGYMNGFTANMTSGRGFIALAACSMGQRTPWGTCIAALVFGCADAMSNSLQVLRVPAQFVQMIPYAVTLLGITIYSVQYAARERNKKKKAALEAAA